MSILWWGVEFSSGSPQGCRVCLSREPWYNGVGVYLTPKAIRDELGDHIFKSIYMKLAEAPLLRDVDLLLGTWLCEEPASQVCPLQLADLMTLPRCPRCFRAAHRSNRLYTLPRRLLLTVDKSFITFEIHIQFKIILVENLTFYLWLLMSMLFSTKCMFYFSFQNKT